MKVTYHNPNESSVHNQERTSEADYAEACRLLERLRVSDSWLRVDVPDAYGVELYIEADRSLWVEITGAEFWAASEIDLGAGQEILKIAFDEGVFGDSIPRLNREWDAYAIFGAQRRMS